MDTFVLKAQTDVGRMKQLEISHDDTGMAAGVNGVGAGAWGGEMLHAAPL
jgi:hypothetical protein